MDASPPESGRRARRGDVASAPRTAAVWEAVQRAVAGLGSGPLVVLDVGGGTGGLAVPLAALGHQVTVVDSSPDALAAFARRADEAGVSDRVRAVQADAAQLPQVAAPDSIDLVCCHGVLEYVDEPSEVLAAIRAVLRPGGAVSLVVAQRSAAVLARALAGRFTEAAHALGDPSGRWGASDPMPRRFDQPALLDLIRAAGLQPRASHGVRLFSDLVPEALVDGEESRAALLDLERLAGDHAEQPALAALATQLHVVAIREQ